MRLLDESRYRLNSLPVHRGGSPLRWCVVLGAATFLAGLLLTFAGWYIGSAHIEVETRERHQEIAMEMRRALETRILVYTEALRGIQSLFEASEEVTRLEFHQFVERLRSTGHYEGIQAFEYVRFLPAGERDAFERRVRTDDSLHPGGYPSFSVHPSDERPFSLVVDYVEPLLGNEIAFGYDVATQEFRLQAALQARDTGRPRATAPIELVQETGSQSAILYYLPVYARGRPTQTPAERRRAFLGLVTGVIRIGDFLHGSLDPRLIARCDFALKDVGPVGPGGEQEPAEDRTLFLNQSPKIPGQDRAEGSPVEVEPLRVAGRTWKLTFHDFRAETPAAVRALPAAILAGGIIFSLLAAAVVAGFTARRRAAALASGLARDLAQSSKETRILSEVFAGSMEGILITDCEGTILDVNDAWCGITGYSRGEVLGKNPKLLQSQWEEGETYEKMWEALGRQGHWEGEIWDRRKDGSLYAVRCTIRAVTDSEGRVTHYVGTQHDVTEYLQRSERAMFLANHDALTGLPSRPLLMDRIQQAILDDERRSVSAMLVYLDLDGFKPINDSLGHLAGDKVLQEVSRRLLSCVRRNDTVARLGGDEFVVLLSGHVAGRNLDALPQKLLEAVNAPMTILGRQVQVSASLGVALSPEDASDAVLLLKCADAAMYRAKKAGPGKCRFFTNTKDTSSVRRLHLGLALRRAMDDDQLEIHYQPEVDFRSGLVSGFEALLRWRHPQRGILPPSAFLHAVEQEEIGVLLGEWVLERACAQARKWEACVSRKCSVAVNAFPTQLLDPGFPDKIRASLAFSGLSPERLQLEISEQDLLRVESEHPVDLECLRALGVQITLDDFGSSVASLSCLNRWRVHRVKIHGSRIREALEAPRNMEMLRAIIAGARQFQIHVVAEGVETGEQLALLKSLGCDSYHGRVYQAPLPAEEVSLFLQRSACPPGGLGVSYGESGSLG